MDKLVLSREIIVSFFWRYLQIISSQGIAFLMFLFIASVLDPIKYGTFAYILAVAEFFVIFCDFGISSATSKYVAENKQKAKAIAFAAFAIIISVSVLITLFLVIFGKLLFNENYNYVLLLIPYLFFVPLSGTLDGIYRGLKEFKRLSWISVFAGLISLGFSLLLIKHMGLVGAILSQNAYYVFMGTSLFINLRKVLKIKKTPKIDLKLSKKILKYGLVIGITSLSFFLYYKADILILQKFGFIAEIGYYDFINKIFAVLLIPFAIAGQIVAPDIAISYSSGKHSYVKKVFLMHLIVYFSLAILATLSAFIIFPFFTSNFFPLFNGFPVIVFNLLLLTLPLRLVAAVITHGHTLPTGNAHYSLWTMIPGAIMNILLNFIFISKYGFFGVVYASLICHTYATLSFSLLYYLKIRRMSENENISNITSI